MIVRVELVGGEALGQGLTDDYRMRIVPAMSRSAETRLIPPGLLRSQAEERLQREGETLGGMSAEQMQAVIHDLHVHQIELEMQNEQLRLSQEDLEAARERFVELYDFAPVGYLTLNKEGLIVQANLTSVSMLGVERSRLVNLSFSRFVSSEDQEAYYHCWRKVFQSAGTHSCELRLRPSSAELFHGRLESVQAIEGGAVVCRMLRGAIARK